MWTRGHTPHPLKGCGSILERPKNWQAMMLSSVSLRRVLNRKGSYPVMHRPTLSQRSYQSQGKKVDKSEPRLDFNNAVEAYQSKTTRELLRHFVVLSAFNFDSIVNRSHKVRWCRWSSWFVFDLHCTGNVIRMQIEYVTPTEASPYRPCLSQHEDRS